MRERSIFTLYVKHSLILEVVLPLGGVSCLQGSPAGEDPHGAGTGLGTLRRGCWGAAAAQALFSGRRRMMMRKQSRW